MTDTYERFRDGIEDVPPDEAELIDKITASLRKNNERAAKKYHHGIRDAHAKFHGLLVGELTVDDDLPEELRQAIFKTPRTYPVVARLSSTAGAIRTDESKGVRGFGLKVIGVEGPRVLPDDTGSNQDFIFVSQRRFPFAGAKTYSTRGMLFAKLLARTPDFGLKLTSRTLTFVDTRILARFGGSLPFAVKLLTLPNTPLLGLSYFTASAFRYGDYIARFAVVPVSPQLVALEKKLVPNGDDVHVGIVRDYLRDNSAEYEFRVQLCTDLKTMPLEDATVDWPERESAHVRVAKLVFPPQDPTTEARKSYGDDILSFNPWHGLDELRPLGSINRLKKLVYEASSTFRHGVNDKPLQEPASAADIPD